MTRRAVVLFARTPEAEAAAKGLDASAARLFEALVASWLRAAEAADAVPVIACEPAARPRLSLIAATVQREYVDQTGGTFGERLSAVAQSAGGRFAAILIAGIDAPPPPLAEAFASLESGAVDGAVAPARDGGVNVIGFREPPLDLLRSFSIDDRSIAARCFRFFPRTFLFPVASDIDSCVRIAAARREHLWQPFLALLSALIPRHRGEVRSAIAHHVSATLSSRGPPPV